MKKFTKKNFNELFNAKKLRRIAVCWDSNIISTIEKIESHNTATGLREKIIQWQSAGSNTTSLDIKDVRCSDGTVVTHKVVGCLIYDQQFIGIEVCYNDPNKFDDNDKIRFETLIYRELELDLFQS